MESDSRQRPFALVRHGGETCALMLEVIANHDYGKSRFLRGANIDETKIADVDAKAAQVEAQPVRYLHPERTTVHFLDKPLSFDDAQESVYRLPPPLIVVGSAGSGKTALTLEKLKHADGEVLYVTQSTYLAQNATCTTPMASSAKTRRPRFSRTANSSNPSACQPDARQAGESFRAGLRACVRGTLSRRSMDTRHSRKSAG